MGKNSNIEWTHHTFNPWRGCTKISPGCANCYAEKLSHRNPTVLGVWGDDGTRAFAAESYWQQPKKWNAAAEAAGERHRVFCASLADVFEDRDELVQPRGRLFQTIWETPHLDWLLLTKRPQNINAMISGIYADKEDLVAEKNIWIGTSVENQAAADERIPRLLQVPVPVRFLSCEPLVGPLALDLRGIDWVIVGGESGPKARPMDIDWVRSIRDQCQADGVPFFFKQWGDVSGRVDRLLDGVQWDELPKGNRT